MNNKMNTELLFQLYAIHSESRNEKKMRKFLRKQAALRGAAKVEQDGLGNLFITKGESETYPCLAAHMDQVQHFHSSDFMCTTAGDDVIGWSPKCHSHQGLGADDKNGIFVCLECLAKYDAIKVAFFVGEEIGCVGSSSCDLEFFKDCRFIIQPDRKGSSDLITSMFCGPVCSEDFINAIGAERFGYVEEEGSVTDVGTLIERGVGISCLNLSCGYYEPHTDHETTNLRDLQNCLEFVQSIVENCTDVYPFEYVEPMYTPYGAYNKSYYSVGNSKVATTSWDDYYLNGYYDEDYEKMMTYFSVDENISLVEIIRDYIYDFNAKWFFGEPAAVDVIEEVYEDVRYEFENSNRTKGTSDDDEDADEFSFDDVTLDGPGIITDNLKKVS